MPFSLISLMSASPYLNVVNLPSAFSKPVREVDAFVQIFSAFAWSGLVMAMSPMVTSGMTGALMAGSFHCGVDDFGRIHQVDIIEKTESAMRFPSPGS